MNGSEQQRVLDDYHRWYYDRGVWETVKFLGVPCLKSVSDMWNYQEIITDLAPTLIVEFGTRYGGAALYFQAIGRLVTPGLTVLTVDIDDSLVDARLRATEGIELMVSSSTAPAVGERILTLRGNSGRPVFVILDSDHSMAHVRDELEMLRPVLRPGDYVVVEDGNINGHPVLPGWGEGPFEAIESYMRAHPDDFARDEARETKFGFTFAPHGFLIRR